MVGAFSAEPEIGDGANGYREHSDAPRDFRSAYYLGGLAFREVDGAEHQKERAEGCEWGRCQYQFGVHLRSAAIGTK